MDAITIMSQSANKRRTVAQPLAIPATGKGEIVTLGASGGSRVASVRAACIAERGRPPRALSWSDFLSNPARLDAIMAKGDYLRIDTPDGDDVGLCADDAANRGLAPPGDLVARLVAGIAMATNIAERKGVLVSCCAADVARAFDKTATLAALRAAGVPTPRVLSGVSDWTSLRAAMDGARMARVFVKLRHGSSAAGMMALARNRDDWIATTTAWLGPDGALYATKRVRRVQDVREIGDLVDRLGALGLHGEEWLPKIGLDGRTVDVRVVLVGDTIMPILRLSRYPMTNLHLDNERGPVDPLIARIGEPAWASALASVRAAAACFPSLQTSGVDLAILNDGRRHAVLEVNAFGDYVKGLEVDGLNPHAAQARRIDRLLRQTEPSA